MRSLTIERDLVGLHQLLILFGAFDTHLGRGVGRLRLCKNSWSSMSFLVMVGKSLSIRSEASATSTAAHGAGI